MTSSATLPPLAIVVLVSGSGSNLQAIIDAIAAGRLDANIRAVISNRDDAFGLQRAHQAGITTRVIRHQDYTSRATFDNALRHTIDRFSPELVVLAGFMRILTDDFVNHFHGQLINIHPSLLPAFPGLNTHRQALAAGMTEHGASIHFVTNQLDGGPVISQIRVPVLADDSVETLAQRVLLAEHRLYPATLQLFCQRRIGQQGGQVSLDGQVLLKPLNLTASGFACAQ